MTYPSKESWGSDQQRIRERAYHLWNDAGRPEGQDLSMWATARYALEQERRVVSA